MSIKEADPVEELTWYHDIKVFLEFDSLPPSTAVIDRKTIVHLAAKYVLGVRHLYKRSYNQMLLVAWTRRKPTRKCSKSMQGHAAHT